MSKANHNNVLGLLAAAGMLGTGTTLAATFEPGVGAGFEYTDNAALTSSNEDDDLILLGYLGGKLDYGTGPLKASGTASLIYQDYTDNTFSDQYYWNADAGITWQQFRQRLDWVVRDRFTQREVDSLAPNTPSNSQDTNIFSFGPNITLPITGRQQLLISPAYRRYYYETSNTDNDEYSLSMAWLHNLRPDLQAGLNGNVSKTEFDNDQVNPNFLSSTLQLVVTGKLARSQYTLAAGADYIQRDDVEDQDGFAGSLDWLTNITGVSSVRLYTATSLTDASTDAYDAATNPGRGNVDNVQVDGDVFQDTILRSEYQRNSPSLTTLLWGELRDLDYKTSPNDREIQGLGFDLIRPVSQRVSTGLHGSFDRVKQTDIDRTNKTYVIGGDMTYRFTGKLRALFSLQYQNRDSNNDPEEYTELLGFVGLVYGYGHVERTRGTVSTPR